MKTMDRSNYLSDSCEREFEAFGSKLVREILSIFLEDVVEVNLEPNPTILNFGQRIEIQTAPLQKHNNSALLKYNIL